MSRYLKATDLKDVVNSTKIFVTWSGSVEQRWDTYIFGFIKIFNDVFFMNSSNEYCVECGWYVKAENVKEVLENMQKELKSETEHSNIAYVTEKYNTIVKYVNEKSEEQLMPKSRVCENKHCLYCRTGVCCNPKQHDETANAELDCELAVRADYDEMMISLRKDIEKKIRYLTLSELLDVNSRCESFEK